MQFATICCSNCIHVRLALVTSSGVLARTVDAPFAAALLELAAERDDVVALSADLAKWTDLRPFAAAHPERFIQVGMAEQNLIGVAAGIAKSGLLPIAVTYGVFATRRAYDQIAMSIASGGTHAVVVGFLPGITSRFHGTHQAIDDVALMRAIPGATVLDPADAGELRAALHAAAAHRGLVYLRAQRGRVADLGAEYRAPFAIGPGRPLRDGGALGVLSSGLGTQWALEALDGIDASLLHVPTLKPFPVAEVQRFCARFERVATVENHSVVGGLAAAVADAIARAGRPVALTPIGIQDGWAAYGTVDHIRRALELDAGSLARVLGELAR
jgi:transketolase